MFKKIIATILCFLPFFLFAESLQSTLTTAVEQTMPQVKTIGKTINYVTIAKEIQFWLFAFLGIIAVGYIIYTGLQLLWATGNEEAMTKANTSLLYIVVGLAIIPCAYFVIQFLTSIRL